MHSFLKFCNLPKRAKTENSAVLLRCETEALIWKIKSKPLTALRTNTSDTFCSASLNTFTISYINGLERFLLNKSGLWRILMDAFPSNIALMLSKNRNAALGCEMPNLNNEKNIIGVPRTGRNHEWHCGSMKFSTTFFKAFQGKFPKLKIEVKNTVLQTNDTSAARASRSDALFLHSSFFVVMYPWS